MIPFLKAMLSNSNSVSFGRCGAFAIVTTWLAICFYISVELKAVVDIPLQWAGLATLLFGITKLAPSKSGGDQ